MSELAKIQYQAPGNLMRFVGNQVARDAKMMAARGLLPLPPRDLVQVLFALGHDPDAELAAAANQTLIKMPENILKTVLEDQSVHPLIYDYLARRLPQESPLLEALALNRAVHDETIAFLAGVPNKRMVDIISENQLRILRCSEIVDNLSENPYIGQAQLDRILKFVAMETKRAAKKSGSGEGMEVEIEEVKEEAGEEAPKAEGEEEEVPTVTEDEDEIAAVTLEDGESAWAKMTFDQELLIDHETKSEEEEAEVETNLYTKIAKMKVANKIKLALMGGAQARSLLIRDANKIVAAAVLKSPRITDNEIESISRSRSVSDDVIRTISNNREWTRGYQVKMNLVQNPKTPLSESVRFMNFLRDKDLNDLARSRNVPSQISTQAKRMIARKEEKAKVKKKD